MITMHRVPALSAGLTICLFVAGCFEGGSGGSDPAAQPPPASAAPGAGAPSADGDATASDIQAFNFSAVAGHETGLRRFATIDGRIAPGYADDVRINFGNGTTAPGLLHGCGGIAQLDDCEVWSTVTYAAPGNYTFTVTYQPPGPFADPVSVSGTARVTAPTDFVIVSVGDSVASGEGNPVHRVELPYAAHWDDAASNYIYPGEDYDLTCHRSVTAGPAQAGRRLVGSDDATFIHIACSGAKFGNEVAGDTDSYWYRRAQIQKIDLQLKWVRERFGRIDVLVLSGGANNVQGGFGNVVTTCVLNNPLEPCSQDEEFKEGLRASIAGLADKYRSFDNLIRCGSPGTAECTYDPDPEKPSGNVPAENQVPTVVAITEYFDPTRDSFGNFPGPLTAGACAGFSVGPAEWEFLYENMVVPLNEQVQAAANRHSWVHVGGIASAFRTHGYCAYDALSPSWVVAIGDSLLWQGNTSGTAHPNAAGQDLYAERIHTEVVRANPPRTTASATTDGQPYSFGTWVATDVEVTLAAYNPIRASGVDDTYFAVDDPQCNPASAASGACAPYLAPIVITESGRHWVSFFSTNDFGAPETRARPVEVLIDKDPPVMSCTPVPVEVWPPNGKFVDVAIEVTAVDAVSGPAQFALAAIEASEGDVGTDVRGFEIGTADTDGAVLARRAGNGPGRTYTFTFEAADAVGNVGSCEAAIVVPHDQRG